MRRGTFRRAAATAATAFVSNEKDNTITVIDMDKLAVTKTIKVGQRPARHHHDEGLQVDPGLHQR